MKKFAGALAIAALLVSSTAWADGGRGRGHGYDHGGYRGHSHHYSRHYGSHRRSNRGHEAAYLVGGLVLGSILVSSLQRRDYERDYSSSYRGYDTPARVVYRGETTVDRRLLRDRNGACYEVWIENGDEHRARLPAAECDW